MIRLFPIVFLAACQGAADPIDDPATTPAGPLDILTEDLAVGSTGEIYQQWLLADGGEGTLWWDLSGDLPEGLVFNPTGAISGRTGVAGTYPLTLGVTDEAGATDAVELVLEVLLGGSTVPCGEVASGAFTEIADVDRDEVDWDATGGWTWLEIPLPDPEITRVEIVVAPRLTAYVPRPGMVPGVDVEPYARWTVDSDSPIRIDLGTSDDLDTYRSFGDPIRVLLVAQEPVDWSMSTVCTDGPIFEYLAFPPTRLGAQVSVDFSVYGSDEGMLYSTDDPLPAWVEFDASEGRITGTAEQAGTWEFDVTVVAPDGAERTETSGFGVYDTVRIDCDMPVQLQTSEAYYDGALTGDSDPRGYLVLEALLDPDISSASLFVGGMDYGLGSLSWPWGEPYWTSNSYQFAFYSDLDLPADPTTFPTIGHFTEGGGTLYATLKPYYDNPLMDVELICDRGPRPDEAVLPVVEPGQADQFLVDVRGGVPPYALSATGLPSGVSLGLDGLLEWDGTATAGTSTVDITVEDAAFEQRTVSYPLWVGEDAACGGAQVLGCGDSVTEMSAGSVFDDFGNASGFCLSREVEAYGSVTLTLTTDPTWEGFVTLGFPGKMGTNTWFEGGSIYAIFASPNVSSSYTLQEDSLPALSDYEGVPIFATTVPYEAGEFTLDVVCDD